MNNKIFMRQISNSFFQNYFLLLKFRSSAPSSDRKTQPIKMTKRAKQSIAEFEGHSNQFQTH